MKIGLLIVFTALSAQGIHLANAMSPFVSPSVELTFKDNGPEFSQLDLDLLQEAAARARRVNTLCPEIRLPEKTNNDFMEERTKLVLNKLLEMKFDSGCTSILPNIPERKHIGVVFEADRRAAIAEDKRRQEIEHDEVRKDEQLVPLFVKSLADALVERTGCKSIGSPEYNRISLDCSSLGLDNPPRFLVKRLHSAPNAYQIAIGWTDHENVGDTERKMVVNSINTSFDMVKIDKGRDKDLSEFFDKKPIENLGGSVIIGGPPYTMIVASKENNIVKRGIFIAGFSEMKKSDIDSEPKSKSLIGSTIDAGSGAAIGSFSSEKHLPRGE